MVGVVVDVQVVAGGPLGTLIFAGGSSRGSRDQGMRTNSRVVESTVGEAPNINVWLMQILLCT
jgi:hypothetical protein